MTTTSTAAYDFLHAFYGIVRGMFQSDPQVLVSNGHPGAATNDDLIVILDMRTKQDPANFGTNRSREEVLELDIAISSFRAGYADNDDVPKQRVYDLLGQIENYCRTTDTTVGGTVRECFLTASTSTGRADQETLAQGRLVDLVATFTAHARISN